MSGYGGAPGPPTPRGPEDALEAQRRTQPLLDPGPTAVAPGPPRWVVPTVAVVAVLALLISVGFGLVQWRLAAEAQADRDALAAEVAELRIEVAALRAEVGGGALPDGGGEGSPFDLEQLFDDLFGGFLEGEEEGAGGFAGLLEEWFSGRDSGG